MTRALLVFLATSLAVCAQQKNSIVGIYAESAQRVQQGSGFWRSSSGDVVTSYHVIVGATTIRIFHANGTAFDSAKVRVLHLDPEHDLALLRAGGAGNQNAVTLSAAWLEADAEIRVLAHPRGLRHQLFTGRTTSGRIRSTELSTTSGRAIFKHEFPVIPVDLTVYGGMSGAPVFNAEGEVVGVIQGSLNEGRGLAWILPAEFVTELSRLPVLNRAPDAITSWPPLLGENAAFRAVVATYRTDPANVRELAAYLADIRQFNALSDELYAAAQDLGLKLNFGSSRFDVGLSAALSRFEKALREKLTLRGQIVEKTGKFEKNLRAAAMPAEGSSAVQSALDTFALAAGEYREKPAEELVGIDTALVLSALEKSSSPGAVAADAVRRISEDYFRGLSPGTQRFIKEKQYFNTWAAIVGKLREYLYYSE